MIFKTETSDRHTSRFQLICADNQRNRNGTNSSEATRQPRPDHMAAHFDDLQLVLEPRTIIAKPKVEVVYGRRHASLELDFERTLPIFPHSLHPSKDCAHSSYTPRISVDFGVELHNQTKDSIHDNSINGFAELESAFQT